MCVCVCVVYFYHELLKIMTFRVKYSMVVIALSFHDYQ